MDGIEISGKVGCFLKNPRASFPGGLTEPIPSMPSFGGGGISSCRGLEMGGFKKGNHCFGWRDDLGALRLGGG